MPTVYFTGEASDNVTIKHDGSKTFYLTADDSFPDGYEVTGATLYLSKVYSYSKYNTFSVYSDSGEELASGLKGDGSSASSNTSASFTWDLDTDASYEGLSSITIEGDGSASSNMLSIRSGCTIEVAVEYEEYYTPTLNSSYPKNVSVMPGSSTTLKVSISEAGYPSSYKYQWYKNSSKISGATSSSLTVTPEGTEKYYCKVTNSAGTVTSRTATVKLYATPELDSTAPANVSLKPGESATLSVKIATAGNPTTYTYQWYKDSKAIAGASSSSLKVTEAGKYYCKVTNTAGTVTSRTATVTVYYVPVLDAANPADVAIIPGSSTTLSVKIATAGNPTTYTYQWYKNGTAISGATSSTYKATAAAKYYCKVTNTAGTVTSRTAVVSELSGGAITVDGARVPATAYIWHNGAWVIAIPYCYANDTWNVCSSG